MKTEITTKTLNSPVHLYISVKNKEHKNKEAISIHILNSWKQVLLNIQLKYLQLVVNYAPQNIKKRNQP